MTTPGEMPTPRIDAALIGQLRELLDTRFEELIERFVHDGNRRLDEINKAIPLQTFATVYAEAHGLKGSSRNIGAIVLGELCAELESLGKTETAEGMVQLFAAVAQEFAAVCDELKNY